MQNPMPESQTIEAIYEDGVLRPLQTLTGVAEHSKVKIIIEYQETPTHPLLQFAGIISDEEAAQLQSVIYQEFEQIDSNGW
ncbi:MAG: antitoxin family protein [Nostoc sp.]